MTPSALRRAGQVAMALASITVGASRSTVAGADANPGGATTRHLQRPGVGVGPRAFAVHQPPASVRSPAGGRPLIVVLHGCTGSAADVEAGSRMSSIADVDGFVVLYPEQTTSAGGDGDPYGCWHWDHPADQHRGRGEPSSIVAMIDSVAAMTAIDRRRIHVIGLSAGAAMAVVLAATYPDVFASVVSLAGCGYLSCTSASGRRVVDELGPRARTSPMLIVQGSEDRTVPPSVGEALADQWIDADDLVDDGAANGSFHRSADSTDRYTPGVGSSGGRCEATGRFPCLGGAGGLGGSYPYTVEHHADARLRDTVDVMVVQGLGHAWSGGDGRGGATDPAGPRVSEGAVAFFAAHPMATIGSTPRRSAVPSAVLASALVVAVGGLAVGLRRRRSARS